MELQLSCMSKLHTESSKSKRLLFFIVLLYLQSLPLLRLLLLPW